MHTANKMEEPNHFSAFNDDILNDIFTFFYEREEQRPDELC